MPKYPIYLDLAGRRAVVIGAGMVAARKAQSLSLAGARVVVVAELIKPGVEQLFGRDPNIEVIISSYHKEYLTGAILVIAATNDQNLNEQIYKDCQTLEVLCNVVDQPRLCDFFVPAVVQKGPLQIAIGTDGNCPAYAGHIRKKLEEVFTEDHGRFVCELEKIRRQLIEKLTEPDKRKAILGDLVTEESFRQFVCKGPDEWQSWAQETIKNNPAETDR